MLEAGGCVRQESGGRGYLTFAFPPGLITRSRRPPSSRNMLAAAYLLRQDRYLRLNHSTISAHALILYGCFQQGFRQQKDRQRFPRPYWASQSFPFAEMGVIRKERHDDNNTATPEMQPLIGKISVHNKNNEQRVSQTVGTSDEAAEGTNLDTSSRSGSSELC